MTEAAPDPTPPAALLDEQGIDALVQRTRGESPTPELGVMGRRARWLRTVDFTRPSKFTTDQERRIRRALDNFAQLAETRLVAEHRAPVELEVLDTQQLTWLDAFSLVSEEAVMATIDTAPHPARMLLTTERPLACVVVERLMGGTPATVDTARQLTEIDLLLVRRFTTTVVEALSSVWFDIAEVSLSVAEIDTQAEAVQVAAGSEPTLALTMEARMDGVASTMMLLIPYAAIAPVASAFSSRDAQVSSHDPRLTAAVQERLSLVDVTLRAEVADATLSLAEVLALRTGDVIRLDGEAGGEITLFADRTPVHRARPGRSGKHRAIQITEPAPADPEAAL